MQISQPIDGHLKFNAGNAYKGSLASDTYSSQSSSFINFNEQDLDMNNERLYH